MKAVGSPSSEELAARAVPERAPRFGVQASCWNHPFRTAPVRTDGSCAGPRASPRGRLQARRKRAQAAERKAARNRPPRLSAFAPAAHPALPGQSQAPRDRGTLPDRSTRRSTSAAWTSTISTWRRALSRACRPPTTPFAWSTDPIRQEPRAPATSRGSATLRSMRSWNHRNGAAPRRAQSRLPGPRPRSARGITGFRCGSAPPIGSSLLGYVLSAGNETALQLGRTRHLVVRVPIRQSGSGELDERVFIARSPKPRPRAVRRA